jgi:hypothetical protein
VLCFSCRGERNRNNPLRTQAVWNQKQARKKTAQMNKKNKSMEACLRELKPFILIVTATHTHAVKYRVLDEATK